jgi:hypothetical protein
LAVAVAYAIVSDRLARGNPQRTWSVFAAGSVVFFTLNVLGNAYFHFRVSGEPLRQVPELDLAFILGAVTVLAWLWEQRRPTLRIVAAVVTLAAFYTTIGYVRHAWHMFPLWPDYTNRVEYRVSEWLHTNMPQSRIYASGSVRFWFDAWHDLAQVGGGSEQGLLNSQVEPAQWEINLGPNAEPGILWLQAMAADAIYVSDKTSQEIFKDLQYPKKFDGLLPVIYDQSQGDKIYRVPRRFPARARVVVTDRLNAVAPPRFNDDVENLRAYVDVIEKGPDSPATIIRGDTDTMVVRAHVDPGESIVVQETYDPAWRAWSGSGELRVRKDAMDMIVVDAPPGDQAILLAFVTPLENRVGRVVSGIALLLVIALIAFGAHVRWTP